MARVDSASTHEGSNMSTGHARRCAAATLLAGITGIAGWTATSGASSAAGSSQDARPAGRAAPSPCGRAVLTIFLGIIDEGATYFRHDMPPGVPLPPGEGATSPQGAARVVASSSGFASSSCGYETSSFVAESVAIIAAFGSIGGQNGFVLLRKSWDALPPAKRRAVEQAILDGKPPGLGASSGASPPKTVVDSVRVLSRSGRTAKVVVTIHVVEAASNRSTDTYLVSLIRGHWYVSGFDDTSSSLG